jgi:hypothetical protein
MPLQSGQYLMVMRINETRTEAFVYHNVNFVEAFVIPQEVAGDPQEYLRKVATKDGLNVLPVSGMSSVFSLVKKN